MELLRSVQKSCKKVLKLLRTNTFGKSGIMVPSHFQALLSGLSAAETQSPEPSITSLCDSWCDTSVSLHTPCTMHYVAGSWAGPPDTQACPSSQFHVRSPLYSPRSTWRHLPVCPIPCTLYTYFSTHARPCRRMANIYVFAITLCVYTAEIAQWRLEGLWDMYKMETDTKILPLTSMACFDDLLRKGKKQAKTSRSITDSRKTSLPVSCISLSSQTFICQFLRNQLLSKTRVSLLSPTSLERILWFNL